MATMRELKGRINSVHSSQKITGAMKMISSARLRKAESRLLHSQPYQKSLWDIYSHIMESGCDYESPLSVARPVKRVAIVIYASDDGLCGGFNITLYKKLLEAIQVWRAAGAGQLTVFPVGKKILYDVDRIPGVKVIKTDGFTGHKDDVDSTRTFADDLAADFLAGNYDCVEVVYMRYKSIGTQIPMRRQFLPVVLEKQPPAAGGQVKPWYIFEPDCETILKMLYPLLLHARMYEMCIENQTSEQAARILAMQLANDNAVKLLGNLQLEYNKLRQQGITSELLDIAGGAVK